MRHLRTFFPIVLGALVGLSVACDSGDSEKSADEKTKKKESASKKKDEKDEDSELPFEATGPVATVDGEEITAEEYNKVVRDKFANSRRPIPKAMAGKLKTKALDKLIDKHLIEREIKNADVSASKEEVEEEFSKFKERFPNEKAFQSFLKFRNTSEEELKGKIKKDVKLRKILRERKGIEVTEEDAKKYYEENPDEYKQKEKVKARHILIKSKESKGGARMKGKKKDPVERSDEEAKKKAEELAKKAKKDGTDFAELAKEHSEGPSQKKGGSLGYFTRDRMVEKFANKAFSMEDGEISDPLKTKFGYHVIKREGYKEAHKKPFEKVKDDVVSTLERKKFRRAIDGFSKELREKAELKKMPDNIKVNVSEKQGGPRGLGLPGKAGGGRKLQMNKLKEIQKKGGSGGESSSSGGE